MKGQAAIMDALLFMLICSGTASLLLYVSGLYASSTNQQVTAVYNYEFAGNAIVAFHYAQDKNNDWFWNEMRHKLTEGETEVEDYLGDEAAGIWSSLTSVSPSPCTILCFQPEFGSEFCYYKKDWCIFDENELEGRSALASAVNLEDDDGKSWTAILKLYY